METLQQNLTDALEKLGEALGEDLADREAGDESTAQDQDTAAAIEKRQKQQVRARRKSENHRRRLQGLGSAERDSQGLSAVARSLVRGVLWFTAPALA